MTAVLIAYFTRPGEERGPAGLYTCRVGHTASAASIVERLCGGDVFKIAPQQPFPADYAACCEMARAQLEADARPPLAAWPTAQALAACRTLILCYPNYFGTMPMPVHTFLQGCDFAGRRILPLCTHGGGGAQRSVQDIARLCPQAQLSPALALPGAGAAAATEDIRLWLLEQGVPLQEA